MIKTMNNQLSSFHHDHGLLWGSAGLLSVKESTVFLLSFLIYENLGLCLSPRKYSVVLRYLPHFVNCSKLVQWHCLNKKVLKGNHLQDKLAKVYATSKSNFGFWFYNMHRFVPFQVIFFNVLK